MDSYIFSEIDNIIFTQEQANRITESIDAFSNSIYDTKSVMKDKISTYFNYQEKELLLKLFNDNKIPLDNLALAQKYLNALKNYIKNLPVLNLYLAIEPKSENINNILYWLNKNLAKKVIININTDLRLIGGVIIEFNGRRVDYSLKKKLSAYANLPRVS